MLQRAAPAFLLVLSLSSCGDLAVASNEERVFKSTDITGIGWGGDFHLTDQTGPEADHVQGLFVTIDPERDSSDVLARYVKAFDRSFFGLRAEPATIAALAKEFKVQFTQGKADAQGNYAVDHMGDVFVFDPKGRLRLLMMPSTGLDTMANDVSTLLKGNA